MEHIGKRIKRLREANEITQARLARRVGVDSQQVGKIERGESNVGRDKLVAYFRVLATNTDEDLAHWILLNEYPHEDKDGIEVQPVEGETFAAREDREALQKKAQRERTQEREERRTALNVALSVLGGSDPTRTTRTLANFPQAFFPLAIVLGDRRERPAKDVGDLLAWSPALPDAMFLYELGLGAAATDRRRVKIVSDKIFARASDGELQAKFADWNILMIGSMSANVGTRLINRGAIFSYAEQGLLTGWRERRLDMVKLLDTPEKLLAFQDLNSEPNRLLEWILDEHVAKSPQLRTEHLPTAAKEVYGLSPIEISAIRALARSILGTRSARTWVYDLRKQGFDDPVRMKRIGADTGEYDDLATVSLANNPFDPTGKHIAIVAAGIHGPGTAMAVRALSTPAKFADRPAGGIIASKLRADIGWDEKISEASSEWVTEPYDTAHLIASLEALRKIEQDDRPFPFNHAADHEVDIFLRVARSIGG